MKNNMPWPTKKIGEVAGVIMGQSPPSSSYNEQGEGLPFFQGKAEFGEIYPTPVKYCSSPSRIAEANDVLISVRAPVGNINIAREKSCVGRGLGALRAKKNVLNQMFLFYFMKKNENNWSRLSTGSTFSAIKGSGLKNFEIPLPPLAIQKQIVERLDKIAEAQKLNDDLIKKSDELFQSLLHQELNPADKNWEVKKLEELIVDTTNGFASRPVVNGIGQLRPNNIDSGGSLNFSSIKFVPRGYRNIKNYFLKKGDILFNNTNSVELVGKTTFIDSDYGYVFSNHMTRIRINKDIAVSQFLAIFLQYLYSLGKFRFLCTPWVNQAAVNSTALKRLKISLPPLKNQNQIVAKLSAAQEYKTQLLAQKSKLKELFESALHKSMQG